MARQNQARRRRKGAGPWEHVRKVGSFHLPGLLVVWGQDKHADIVLPAGGWAASLILKADGTEYLLLKPLAELRRIRESRWQVRTTLHYGKWSTLALAPLLISPSPFSSDSRIHLLVEDGNLVSLQIRDVGREVEVKVATECQQVVGVKLEWKRSRSSRTKLGS